MRKLQAGWIPMKVSVCSSGYPVLTLACAVHPSLRSADPDTITAAIKDFLAEQRKRQLLHPLDRGMTFLVAPVPENDLPDQPIHYVIPGKPDRVSLDPPI